MKWIDDVKDAAGKRWMRAANNREAQKQMSNNGIVRADGKRKKDVTFYILVC